MVFAGILVSLSVTAISQTFVTTALPTMVGDLGGFGPNPEKVRPLLAAGDVRVLQGNYEESLATGREDCNCGYTDPRDNHFAAVSYGYTARNCSPDFKAWMGELPRRRRVLIGDRELLLVHGSPRRINEFLFASTSPVPFLEVLLDQNRCDALLCTHTGLQWHRRLPSGRDAVNVGVLGRPANDGATHVWYALVEARDEGLDVELRPLVYDHQALAAEMRRESRSWEMRVRPSSASAASCHRRLRCTSTRSTGIPSRRASRQIRTSASRSGASGSSPGARGALTAARSASSTS